MATPSGSGSEPRQKRVLPSRPRRGGTGVGSCDADALILDTGKRQFENGPLIPAETRFLLTTNSSFVPSASTAAASELEVNNHVKERYFERPEVLKAFKEQQLIETPDFIKLGEVYGVGGRFRPRGSDDQEDADTSDAAYEKRHRKYETFEKRQRLREKEKLKHEQYKLKERIEQLRAMDGAAFLALPASSFSPIPGLPAGDSGDDASSVHVNGASAHNEGERRRKEMLDIGMTLEERYRTLLPPDRKGMERERLSYSASVEPEHLATPDSESDLTAQAIVVESSKREKDKLKLKIKFPHKPNLSSSHISASPKPSLSTKRSAASGLPPHINTQPARTRQSKATLPSPLPAQSMSPTLPAQRSEHNTRSSTFHSQPAQSPAFTPTSPVPSPEADGVPPPFTESISQARPRKRMKPSTPEPPEEPVVDSISAPVQNLNGRPVQMSKLFASQAAAITRKAEQTKSSLVIAALRTTGVPNARKTQRNVTAFGTKVPWELEEVMDYELPPWIVGEGDDESDGDDYYQEGVGQSPQRGFDHGEATGDDPVEAEG